MRHRVLIAVAAFFFLLGFGALGAMSAYSLYGTFSAWHASKGYVKVQAKIQSVEFQEWPSLSLRFGSTYRTVARYEYEFAGLRRISNRLDLESPSSFDSVGSYHKQAAESLNYAKAQSMPVDAWVDPKQPDTAILYRDLRWGKVWLLLPLAVMFSLLAVAAAYMVWISTIRARSGTLLRLLQSDLLNAWLMTFAWNGICLPLYFGLMLGDPTVSLLIKAVFALFPALGLMMLLGAIKMTLARLSR